VVGVRYAVDDLFVQLQRLPAFAPRAKPPSPAGGGAAASGVPGTSTPRGVIVVEPPIDAATGQQTAASRQLEKEVLQRATERFTQFEVLPNDSANLRRAEYLITGVMVPVTSAAEPGTLRLSLSVSEIKRGLVVAQSAVRVQGAGVDTTPTAFYRDSPSLTKDRVVEGQIRTAETPAGGDADALYLERLPVAALVNEGVQRYETGNYAEALRYYEEAAKRTDGQQLRVLNGLYLTNSQLGKAEAAEESFGRIVALGMATNTLSMKFLFRPGSTDFWPDPKVTAPYPMWLRTIAREVVATLSCLTVVGHTSRTGSEQVNERLSLARAVAIQRRLAVLAPDAAKRLEAVGMGYRENLIGTGTDDVRDALDRRVEFRVRPC
jgi:outer membrane protein OmpA-like peptidoglycan-associated protein